ncbi:hypothetical protein LPJ66_007589 [Kickxella alabastrina]|uniref:Uncharacterized protein n=1 Tax=Kickxella alabastrina TaxID=61397 RepID=A0ACC1IAS3_9FUNG|nr:hypothetical protein LPJ66_007589 [Kickxella alabastrina]
MKTASKFSSIIVLATLTFSGVFGHTFLNNLIIDSKDVSNGKCIRPVTGLKTMYVGDTSNVNMRCRPGNQSPSATAICPVKAGSEMGVEWHHSSKTPTDNIISQSHRGPCLIYMARMDQPIDGNVWFKVYEEAYDESTKEWCTDKIRRNKGVLKFTIPADIESGDYLLRTEIIALHGAQRRGYAQFFPNCAQVSVTGGGSAKPKGYKIPGIYTADDPGIFVNYRKVNVNYVIPGPPVYVPGNNSTIKSVLSSSSSRIADDTLTYTETFNIND